MSSTHRVSHSSHWGAFDAIVRDGRLVDVVPRAGDPCPAAFLQAVKDGPYSSLRVKRPSFRRGWLDGQRRGARRGDDRFVELPWDEALDIVAQELRRVYQECGPSSIFGGSYGWSSAGRFHHAKSQLQRFLSCAGGYVNGTQNYSMAAGLVLLPHLLGSEQACTGPVTGWDSIAADGKLVVAFGGVAFKNLAVAAGGMGSHEAQVLIAKAKKAGVRFINISPLREDLPGEIESEWIPIRPNTDTAVMLAMIHVLLDEGLSQAEFCDRYCVGADRVAAYVQGDVDGVVKTPEWAEALSGVPAATLRRLAREMATVRTTISVAWSLQRAENGEQPFWAALSVAAFLGQIGLPGGGVAFGLGSIGGMGVPREPLRSPNLPPIANPCKVSIPVARVGDMLLRPGEQYEFNGETRRYPDIELVYWVGGNPFHHHQDINRLVDAFTRPATIIVNESWWTSTARLSDIVLPCTTTLEREDIGASAKDRFILAMKQAIRPVGDARDDYEIFSALASRLGFADRFTESRTPRQWIRALYDAARQAAPERMPDFDRFWEQGFVEIPAPGKHYIYLSEFRTDPESFPLKTPSGKIELYSATVADFGYDECPGYPVWRPQSRSKDGRFPLHLISHQPKTRLHSQLAFAAPSVEERINGLEQLRMHPDDASRRGLSDGQAVRVFNDLGETRAALRLSADLAPHVVVLATGAWYAPESWGHRGARELAGNPNVLTPDIGTSRLSQGSSAMSALVEVEPLTTVLAAAPSTVPELDASRS